MISCVALDKGPPFSSSVVWSWFVEQPLEALAERE